MKVKVIGSTTAARSLSMKVVDQESGADLEAEKARKTTDLRFCLPCFLLKGAARLAAPLPLAPLPGLHRYPDQGTLSPPTNCAGDSDLDEGPRRNTFASRRWRKLGEAVSEPALAVFAVVLVLLGLVLAAGGAWLVALGGSALLPPCGPGGDLGILCLAIVWRLALPAGLCGDRYLGALGSGTGWQGPCRAWSGRWCWP